MEKKETLGSVALQSEQKLLQEAEHTVAERTEQATDERVRILNEAFELGKQKFDGDFYIEMCMKREKLFWNVETRWLPHVRRSCPTPMFEQTVYRYNRAEDILEYIWALPDINTACFLLENALVLPPEQKELIDFVIDFKEGRLHQIMLELEKADQRSLNKAIG